MRIKLLANDKIYKNILNLRHFILSIMNFYYNNVYGMSIHKTARISLKAKLDKTNPKGVVIGSYSYVAFGAVILTHDFLNNIHCNTVIGEKCFIGCNSIILPGVTIGDEVVVAAGSVVTKNIESNCLVGGNPAKVIRKIHTKNYGQLIK
jgi:acetyltransferase-like isoleucine patch superfamily enzyme